MERIHRKLPVCGTVLLLVLVVDAFSRGQPSAPAPTYEVYVIITDAQGAAIATAKVVFERGSITIPTQTGADGTVHLRLPSGHYVVMIECRGFKTTKVVDFSVQPDGTPAVLRVVLHPGREAASPL
jgi:hypothetical protein